MTTKNSIPRRICLSMFLSRRHLLKFLRSPRGRYITLGFLLISILFIYFEKRSSMNYKILSALGSRNASELVLPLEETTIFQPIKRCQGRGRGTLAVILVTTLPENTERRDSIRKTWANWSLDFDVMVFFFSGRSKEFSQMQKLEDEVYLHGDLVLEELKEDYHALTIKTLRMLKWYLNHCSEAKFLIKTDDDVFLNIPNMVLHLEKVFKSQEYSNYIGGEVHTGRAPHDVNVFSKWYIPPEIWPTGEVLPPYTGGPCYVLSSEVVPKLFTKSLTTPMINLEDVYLIGVVGYQKLGIKSRNIPNLYDAHYPRLNYYMSKSKIIQSYNAFHTDGDVGLMFLLYDAVKSS